MEITSKEFDAWSEYEIGRPCGKHPLNLIKRSKWGNWCGAKDELGVWCNGTIPTQEWIDNFRKEQYEQ